MFFDFFRQKDKKEQHAANSLPGFLVLPDDPISRKMFGGDLTDVKDARCGYFIQVNEAYQRKAPCVRKKSAQFEIDEVHIYSREGIPSWYAVHTMKTPMVKTSPLEGLVMHPYQLSQMTEMPELMVTAPDHMDIDGYESVRLHSLGSWPEYDKARRLDESKVFCHVFRMNGTVYKDYILCARKGDRAWKLECYIVSQNGDLELSPVDFVPPGFLFGGFKPV